MRDEIENWQKEVGLEPEVFAIQIIDETIGEDGEMEVSYSNISLPQRETDLLKQFREIENGGKGVYTGYFYTREDCEYLNLELEHSTKLEWEDINNLNTIAQLIGEESHPAVESYIKRSGSAYFESRNFETKNTRIMQNIANVFMQEKDITLSNHLPLNWYTIEEIRQELSQQQDRKPERQTSPLNITIKGYYDNFYGEDYGSMPGSYDEPEHYSFSDKQTITLPLPEAELPSMEGEEAYFRKITDISYRSDCNYLKYGIDRRDETLSDWNAVARLIGNEFHPMVKKYMRAYHKASRKLSLPEFANLLMQEKELPYPVPEFQQTDEPDLQRYTMEEIRQGLEEQYGKDVRLFVDMDGTLTQFKSIDAMESLYEQGYFLNLEPQQNVVDAIKKIIQNHPEKQVYIMSSVLSDSKYALQEKNEWLNRYLPEIDQKHRIFPPCGKDKQNYVPGRPRISDCLLDDYTHNLIQWGKTVQGIKLLNGINHTKESWDGNMLRYDKTPDELAQNILDIMEQKELIRDERPVPQKVWMENQAYDPKVKPGYISEEVKTNLEYLTKEQALSARKEGIHICYVNDYKVYHGSHTDEYGISELRKEQGISNLYDTCGRGIVHKAFISPYYDNPGELKKLLQEKTVHQDQKKQQQPIPDIAPSL